MAENNVLDDLRDAEKQIKMTMLVKNLAKLKELAKDVLIAKETMNVYLDQLGMTEAEKKKVIDFINSLSEVRVTKRDEDSIAEEVSRSLDSVKKSIEKGIQDKGITFAAGGGGWGTGANVFTTTAGINNAIYTSAATLVNGNGVRFTL